MQVIEDGECYELRFLSTEVKKQKEEIVYLQYILPNYHHYFTVQL
jgi:hypothetical protein